MDEAYRCRLWEWLSRTRQRCGATFTVREAAPFTSWAADAYMSDIESGLRHFVVATDDDVVEVLSRNQPEWEAA